MVVYPLKHILHPQFLVKQIHKFEKIEQYNLKVYKYPANSRTRLYALVESNGDSYNAKVVDKKGEIYLALTGYATVELPSAMDDNLLDPIKKVMQ